VFGVFVSGYAACVSLAREMRTGTASAVLSKPVSREIFFLAKKRIKIRDIPKLAIEDPYPHLEKIVKSEDHIVLLNNCKDFAAFLLVPLICLPISNRPRVYIQFGKTHGGQDHVRVCVCFEGEDKLTPLDLEGLLDFKVSYTSQIGGKKY